MDAEAVREIFQVNEDSNDPTFGLQKYQVVFPAQGFVSQRTEGIKMLDLTFPC